mgnify:CR=1 FL=1
MEIALLAFDVCLSNVFCFAFGVKVGQSVNKGEKILPSLPKIVTPKQTAKREQDALNVILQNVENYNGTPEGQKDIPWR